MKTIRHLFLCVGLFLLLQACATVPITNRKQMNLLPTATMVQMGFTNYSKFMKENPVSQNNGAKVMLKRVGTKVSSAVTSFMVQSGAENQMAHYKWEFNLVKDKTPNAWCMPGGKIVFYEGILPLTKDENGMAVVMGHEIAHAIARHGNERMSQQLAAQFGVMALSKAIEEEPEQTQQLFLLAFGIGSQLGVMLPFSRMHEREADRLGLIFMAMGGYDPNGAIAFWERMAAQNKQAIPEWLSTHPLDDTRIADMKVNLPEALTYYEAAKGK